MSVKNVTIAYNLDDNVSGGLNKIRQNGQSAFNKVGSSAKKADKNVKSVASTNFKPMMSSLMRITSLLGLGFGLRELINTRVEYENFQAVLGNMYGDMAKGQSQLDNLTQFAKDTPNQLNQVIDSFVKLKGVGIEATNNELMALSDLGAAAGKGILDSAMALQASLTGEFERLKGLNVVARVQGDKLAVTYKNQTTLIERNNDAIKNYLFNLGRMNGVAGTSQKMMDTMGGALSNMKDSAYFALNSLAEMNRNGIVSVIKGISNLLQQTPKIIKWFEKWGYVIKPVLAGLAGFFIINKITKMIKGLTVAFKALNLAMKANPFVLIASLLVTVGVALWELSKKFGGFKNMLAATGKVIGGFAKGVWADIKILGLNIGFFFRDIGLNIAEFFVNIANKVKTFFTNVKIFFKKIGFIFENFWLKIQSFGEGIKNFFKQVGQALTLVAKGQFGQAMDVMSNKMENKFDSIIAERKKQQEDEIKKLEQENALPKRNKITELKESNKKRDEELFKNLKADRQAGYAQSKSMFDKMKRVITKKEGEDTTSSTTSNGGLGSTETTTGGGLTSGGAATLSTTRDVRSVSLSINNLINEFNLNTTNLTESTPQIKREITTMLQKAVIDATGFQN